VGKEFRGVPQSSRNADVVRTLHRTAAVYLNILSNLLFLPFDSNSVAATSSVA